MKIILASSSPRRQKILKRLDCPFEIISPNVDESIISLNNDPVIYCTKLAKIKTSNISNSYPNALVIGADTIVFFKNRIINKPIDLNKAKQILRLLSNQKHNVYTGVSIYWKEKNIFHSFIEISHVTFRKLDEKEIDYYINTYTPLDKAGSYGIQDWSAIFVKKISGCYDNIMGFPLSKFFSELKKLNINILETNSQSS